MASPEVPRLARRLDEQDDTIRALSDTALDIKDTVKSIQRTQDEHGQVLAQHSDLLGSIQRTQDEHGQVLAQHSGLLASIQQTQVQQGEVLAEVLRRLSETRSAPPRGDSC
ncbi:MAG TPA: hypothetical protein VN327_08070 [Pseudonocardiaceae bacterium]|nr:hypothetical protein [Pseudonocardiaceae bacterium]